MATLHVALEKVAEEAAAVVSRFTQVRQVMLFGSQVNGNATEWSDIDVALFISDHAAWDLEKRVKVSSAVMRELGSDVEVHFFPAEALVECDPASFSAWVLKHGVKVKFPRQN